MTSIAVNTGRPYSVEIGHGLLPLLGEKLCVLLPKAERIAIVTDTTVAPLYLQTVTQSLAAADFAVCAFSIPAGEVSKNGATYLSLLDFLCTHALTRSDALLALGGGVVGDLAGFAAATYLRGIPFVQVPTTLLAAVDSSVGGKTAIDLPAGKNLAGAFYQPSLVLCDLDTFQTLPDAVFSDGCAEVVKYGLLGSADLWETLAHGGLDADLESVVAHCVSMKRDIVQRDEFDTGERQLLNLGHTLGHAIEACSHYTVSHGHAVAIGMVLITHAAVQLSLCPPLVLERLQALLTHFSLPTHTTFSSDALYAAALGDKKREGGRLTLIIPRALGHAERHSIPVEEFNTWIERGLAL